MKKIVPWLVALALFIETLDATIISTAIPKIAASLQTDPIALKVALTSYLLSLAIFIPISGWMADRYGSKRVFISAIGVFTLGSLCCGLAIDLTTLVLARIMQGIGGAMMMPVARLILLKTFAKEDLVQATNLATIPSLMGPALGPVIGGVIATYTSWRWIFLVNIPFGLVGMMIANRYLVSYREQTYQLDKWGFMLFGAGIALFAFSLEAIGEMFVSGHLIIIFLVLSLILLASYFLRSRRVAHPILNLDVFNTRTFRITVLGSFLSRCGIGGMPFLLPLFFQLGFGSSPLKSGLLLLPFALAMIAMKYLVKPILRRLGFRMTLVLNTVFLSMTIVQFAFVSPNITLLSLVIILCLHGLATSLQFSCMNVLSYVDLSSKLTSAGTSIGSCIQQLSMSFGVAIAAITLRSLLGEGHSSFQIQVHIFHETFFVLAMIVFMTTWIFLSLKGSDGLQASGVKIES